MPTISRITNGCKGYGMIADAGVTSVLKYHPLKEARMSIFVSEPVDNLGRIPNQPAKDFDSLNKVVPCYSNNETEVQFQFEYTNDIFQKVYRDFREKMNCIVSLIRD
ncbi:hypothetical protein Ahy_B03g066260 [Arachis hypogaea]|uniref:Uncharacterized protein n=1 Tax=Arachis hypogaea TaxID=3818 RepID=A0A445A3L1_ARAHY|nr:hypothetical protein Ahy_B03g066260 [Arachis hypogaea]